MEAPSLLFRLAGSTGQVIGKLAGNTEAICCFLCTPVRTGCQVCAKTFGQTSEMADNLAKKASNLLTVLPEGTQVRPECSKLFMQSVLHTHNPDVPQVDLPFTATEVTDTMWCAVVCDMTDQKLHELQWYDQHSARLQASHLYSSTLFCSPLPGVLCWLHWCPHICDGQLSLCWIHQSCLLCILIYRSCFVMQAICTSSLDNRELWLQVEEAGNIVQSCKNFLQSYSSGLAAELLDDASILLSKHIQEVIAALCTSSTPIGRPSSL